MKRLFDIVVSACALLVLALPLWVLMWQVRRKLGSQVIRNVRGLGWRVSKSE